MPAGDEVAPTERVWPRVDLRLGEAQERCGHSEVVGVMPMLWVLMRDLQPDGDYTRTVRITLHLTAAGWRACSSSPDESPTDDPEARWWVEHALSTVDAVPEEEWWARYRRQCAESMRLWQGKLRQTEVEQGCIRAKIRSLECAVAVAGLEAGPAAEVARRLLPEWYGSAEDLVATARALAGS